MRTSYHGSITICLFTEKQYKRIIRACTTASMFYILLFFYLKLRDVRVCAWAIDSIDDLMDVFWYWCLSRICGHTATEATSATSATETNQPRNRRWWSSPTAFQESSQSRPKLFDYTNTLFSNAARLPLHKKKQTASLHRTLNLGLCNVPALAQSFIDRFHI